MNTALWGVIALLVIVFLGAGVEKLATPISDMRARRSWARDVPSRQVRFLGTLEVLGALGLVVPTATGIAPWLSAVAAACLALLMLGAIATHIRFREPATAYFLPVVTLALAVAVSVALAVVYL